MFKRIFKFLDPIFIRGLTFGVIFTIIFGIGITSSSNTFFFGVLFGALILIFIGLIISQFFFNKQQKFISEELLKDKEKISNEIKSDTAEIIKTIKKDNYENDLPDIITKLNLFKYISGFSKLAYMLVLRILSLSTFIAVFGLLLSFAIFYATYQQVNLLKIQNERMDIQNQLIEAERRGSSFFLLSNIMDRVNYEINDANNLEGKLTQGLKGQIIATVSTLLPYRYIKENGKLSDYKSPEKGQFLIFLLNSNIHHKDLAEILSTAKFQYAEIPYLRIENVYVVGLDLSNSSIDKLILSNDTIFSELILKNANIGSLEIINSLTRGIDFQNANVGAFRYYNSHNLHGIRKRNFNLSKAYIVYRPPINWTKNKIKKR